MRRRHPLVLATANEGKVREFSKLLGDRFDVVSVTQVAEERGVPVPEVEEIGASYYENAVRKAVAYQRFAKAPVLSDDSGLEVELLGDLPGIYSARYGGTDLSWPARWAKLQQELSALAPGPWRARFRCVLCYANGAAPPLFFEGITNGAVVAESQGHQGFGYDPIFWSDDLKKTFGAASDEEKERTSHRGRAVLAFQRWWAERAILLADA